MAAVKIALEILFIIVCIALTVIILMQEGKSAGLGAIAGAADTYWGKNKGRSMEGMLVKLTRVLVVLFIVISAVLNIEENEYLSTSQILELEHRGEGSMQVPCWPL